MIENNIIKSLGAGSGIDTSSLVKQLTDIERSGPQGRIDAKRDKAEAQISDFGLMASAMDKLKSAVTALTAKEGLFSKSAAFTDSDALVPSKIDTNAQTGSFGVEVKSLAASQALNFEALTSKEAAVGQGVLTFNFGKWTRNVSGDPTTFTPGTEGKTFSVTIGANNNTLDGLKNAINDANMGVQASVLFDGTGYRLVMSSPSGANQELQITAAETGGTPTNTDSNDLSRFAFTTGIASLADVETQAGADAELKVNGLTVTRSSNKVTDVIEGLTLDLLKASPGETVTVTVSDDKQFAEEKIRGMVEAYNTFLTDTKKVFSFDEEKEKMGSLANDALAKSVLNRFKSVIASAVPGLDSSNFTALTNLGIRTELNGTLKINEDDFKAALSDNFKDIQKVLAPTTYSSSGEIKVKSFGKQTKAGNYDVVVTTPPKKGFYTGAALGGAVVFPNFDSTGKTYDFKLNVNGVETNTIALSANATYATTESLVSALQTAINTDAKLTAASTKVVVSFDAGTQKLSFTSGRYGSASKVDVMAASAHSIADLGLTVALGNQGVDTAGTVDGVAGFGLGNVLLPKLGEAGEGLSMIIGDQATTSRVDFSRGFSGQMEEILGLFMQTNGLFDSREKLLKTQLTDLGDQEKLLDKRMDGFSNRLMQQYIAMEGILNGLNSQGGFLDNLIDTLPFTAKR